MTRRQAKAVGQAPCPPGIARGRWKRGLIIRRHGNGLRVGDPLVKANADQRL